MYFLVPNHIVGRMKLSIIYIQKSVTLSRNFLILECLLVRQICPLKSLKSLSHSPFFFLGYASNLYEILKTPIKNTDDDQLYYTRAFLDKELREKLKFKLDYKSELFQNLNGAIGTAITIIKKINFELNFDFYFRSSKIRVR